MSQKTTLIACQTLQPELELFDISTEALEIKCLDQGLHLTPAKMVQRLQEAINGVYPRTDSVVLGYGLCGRGIEGLIAPRAGLVVPRCHDCISLLLGSLETYQRLLRKEPGTFFLSPGWLIYGRDPEQIFEEMYVPRLGREKARGMVELEYRHYTRVLLIDTGVPGLRAHRRRAAEVARFLGKDFAQISGDLGWLRQVALGPRPPERFLHLRGGEKIDAMMFYDLD